MALSPGNKATPVDEKVVGSARDKNQECDVRIFDGAGEGERKQEFIKHLLCEHLVCAAYFTCITTLILTTTLESGY